MLLVSTYANDFFLVLDCVPLSICSLNPFKIRISKDNKNNWMKNEPRHKDQAVRLPNQFPNVEKILLTMPIHT